MVIFLAHAEKTEAGERLTESARTLYEKLRHPFSRSDEASRLSEFYVHGSQAFSNTIGCLQPVVDLHLRLEHVKTNTKQEGPRKAPGKATRRLSDPAMRRYIDTRVMLFADLPENMEFDIWTRDFTNRLHSIWHEADVPAHLQHFIFYESEMGM